MSRICPKQNQSVKATSLKTAKIVIPSKQKQRKEQINQQIKHCLRRECRSGIPFFSGKGEKHMSRLHEMTPLQRQFAEEHQNIVALWVEWILLQVPLERH